MSRARIESLSIALHAPGAVANASMKWRAIIIG
jgi:hypothetical protein